MIHNAVWYFALVFKNSRCSCGVQVQMPMNDEVSCVVKSPSFTELFLLVLDVTLSAPSAIHWYLHTSLCTSICNSIQPKRKTMQSTKNCIGIQIERKYNQPSSNLLALCINDTNLSAKISIHKNFLNNRSLNATSLESDLTEYTAKL